MESQVTVWKHDMQKIKPIHFPADLIALSRDLGRKNVSILFDTLCLLMSSYEVLQKLKTVLISVPFIDACKCFYSCIKTEGRKLMTIFDQRGQHHIQHQENIAGNQYKNIGATQNVADVIAELENIWKEVNLAKVNHIIGEA
jgi:hypothetical protein